MVRNGWVSICDFFAFFPAVSFVFSPLSCLYSSVSSSLLAQIQLHHQHTAPARVDRWRPKVVAQDPSWLKRSTGSPFVKEGNHSTNRRTRWDTCLQQFDDSNFGCPLAWLLRAANVKSFGTLTALNTRDMIRGQPALRLSGGTRKPQKGGTWWGTSPKVGNNQPKIMGIYGYPPQSHPLQGIRPYFKGLGIGGIPLDPHENNHRSKFRSHNWKNDIFKKYMFHCEGDRLDDQVSFISHGLVTVSIYDEL